MYAEKKMYESVVNAGCFDHLGYNRHALIEAYDADYLKSDFSRSELLCHINNVVVEDRNADKSYNMSKEIEYLGMIVSEHPLADYHDDSEYKCTPMDQLTESKNISVYGYVTDSEQKKSSKGNDMLVLNLQGKHGSCIVYLMSSSFGQYKASDLCNKVIKVTGASTEDGRVFARKFEFFKNTKDEFLIRLETEDQTSEFSTIMGRQTSDGSICCKILCSWLKHDDHLYQTDHPKMVERYLHADDIKYLKDHGVPIKKWTPKYERK